MGVTEQSTRESAITELESALVTGRRIWPQEVRQLVRILRMCAEPSRKIDLDAEIKRQESVMRETIESKDKDPTDCLRYRTAQAIKVYLLGVYAMQLGSELSGAWIIGPDGDEVCSVCWRPRRIAELGAECAGCGATMKTGGDINAKAKDR